jgi:hypothetical protein
MDASVSPVERETPVPDDLGSSADRWPRFRNRLRERAWAGRRRRQFLIVLIARELGHIGDARLSKEQSRLGPRRRVAAAQIPTQRTRPTREEEFMSTINLRRPLLALAVPVGLLAVAGPAGARGREADFTRFGNDAPILGGAFTVDPQDGATRLKGDGNQIVVDGFWLGSNDALGAFSSAREIDVWETVSLSVPDVTVIPN